MNKMTYILDGHEPVEENDIHAWARWIEATKGNRSVAYTQIGDTTVSTVFLGVNYNFAPDGVPLLFETMVFKENGLGPTERYVTWEQAEAGHQAIVEQIKKEGH